MLRWNKIYLRHFKPGIYEIAASGIIVLAILVRVLLIAYGWPHTESDEGAIDLMALHIAYRGEHPIFIYGQNYMGSLEAFLGAGLFHFFGVSVFTVRLGLVIFFSLFLISMYLMTSLLYNKKFALFTLLLLSLGSSSMLSREVEALGGRPENLFLGSMMILISFLLALTYRQDISRRKQIVRNALYGILGLTTGLAIWSDLLILPFVLMVALFLVFCCWQEIRRWTFVCLVLGLLIGVLPFIVFNIRAPSGWDIFSTLQWVRQGPNSFATYHLPLTQGIIVTVQESLPHATGAYPLCPVEILPFPEHLGPHGLPCTLMYGGWGLGYITLWILAVLLVIPGLQKFWSHYRIKKVSSEDKQDAIRHAAWLVLPGGAVLTLLLFALSPQTAVLPFRSVRYLTYLLVAVPAVIWPLWRGASRIQQLLPFKGDTIKVIFCQALLLLIAVTLLLDTLNTFGEIPKAQAVTQQQTRLIQDLQRIHVAHIYADYETCYWLVFATHEQIICSPLEGSTLDPYNKYPRYGTIVRNDPYSAYVFPLHSPQTATLAQKAAASPDRYQRLEFDGYVIYRPHAPRLETAYPTLTG
jgi:4-amino-4-deoxy-L-arabinose transferase-like glycosyltransferase